MSRRPCKTATLSGVPQRVDTVLTGTPWSIMNCTVSTEKQAAVYMGVSIHGVQTFASAPCWISSSRIKMLTTDVTAKVTGSSAALTSATSASAVMSASATYVAMNRAASNSGESPFLSVALTSAPCANSNCTASAVLAKCSAVFSRTFLTWTSAPFSSKSLTTPVFSDFTAENSGVSLAWPRTLTSVVKKSFSNTQDVK